MKQMVNGVLYNTEISKQIGVRCKDAANGRLNAETLYKTRDGKYFLCESDILAGNASGRNTAGKITPLAAEEADAWAKKHLGEYAYAAEFGQTQPGGTNTPRILSISLPPDLIRKLEELQTGQGKNISQIIEAALRKEFL